MQEFSSPEGSKFNIDMSRNPNIKFNLRDAMNKITGPGNTSTCTNLSNLEGSRTLTDRGPQYSPERDKQWPEPFGRKQASDSPRRPFDLAPENSTSSFGHPRTLDPTMSPIAKGGNQRGIFKAVGVLAPDALRIRTPPFKLKIEELE
jgi:hypothetical protein